MIKSEAVHCTALTKGEKFLHNKISYEIYSEAGTYHKQHGIENQDAVRVGCSNDTNCFYCCMSDGASFCPKAENVAWCTVDNDEKVLRKESISSINENDGKRIAKEIVLKIRSSLYQYAIKNDLEFEKLCSTLIIFYINLETKEYMIIHIGDGLVGNIDEENSVEMLSFPQNGITPRYTYFCNNNNVFKKSLRIYFGKIKKNSSVIVATDGVYEQSNIFNILPKQIKQTKHCDDATFCLINLSISTD